MRSITAAFISIGLAIAGCSGRSEVPPSPAPGTAGPGASTVPSSLTCQPPKRLCTGCTGGEFCALRCPECAPSGRDPAPQQTAALTCQPPLRSCIDCNGLPICARQCPACPPPSELVDEPAAPPLADLVCKPPERACISCNGTAFCGIQCPACAPLARPEAAVAAIGPDVETCGGRICSAGTFCCNPSCGICTPKGVECTQQSCN